VVVNKDVVLPDRREATVADLKLSRPPDRTPVKLTIVVTPDLEQTLDDYLLIYRATYQDEAPSVADLVPAILETFLANDRGFVRARVNLRISWPREDRPTIRHRELRTICGFRLERLRNIGWLGEAAFSQVRAESLLCVG
jgi:hypothetical protein